MFWRVWTAVETKVGKIGWQKQNERREEGKDKGKKKEKDHGGEKSNRGMRDLG